MNKDEGASMDYIKKIPLIAVLLVFLFFGLKGCVMTLWTYPKQIEAFSIEGYDNREAIMIFMPNKETVLWYSDPEKNTVEVLLMKMRGNYGTHYIGPLWTTEGLLGYHWCPDGIKPVEMEVTTLNKYKEGYGDSEFPKIGSRRNSVFYFAQDSLKWEDMWFNRMAITEEQVSQLYSVVAIAEQ